MEMWLEKIRDAKKTCVIEGGRKKVLYVFPDGKEMAEEYNMDTQIINKRAWKKEKTLGRNPEWEIEIGDPSLPTSVFDSGDIQISSDAPVMTSRITRGCLEWRIRNLPYPLETYKVTADDENKMIVVSTTNKKFFKKISIPDLRRLGLPVEQDKMTVSHKYNTLIISYKKPAEMIVFEKLLLEEINRIETQKDENPLQCPTS